MKGSPLLFGLLLLVAHMRPWWAVPSAIPAEGRDHRRRGQRPTTLELEMIPSGADALLVIMLLLLLLRGSGLWRVRSRSRITSKKCLNSMAVGQRPRNLFPQSSLPPARALPGRGEIWGQVPGAVPPSTIAWPSGPTRSATNQSILRRLRTRRVSRSPQIDNMLVVLFR